MIRLLFVSAMLTLACAPALGSDHADPVFHDQAVESLGGLFVYPEGDRLVVILTLHPGLESEPPIEDLDQMTYTVHFDLESKVSFDDPAQKARYGGTVNHPGGIESTASLSFELDNQVALTDFSGTGVLHNPQGLRHYAGIRDDPFIFPRFFGTNVIALAAEIPLSRFGANQHDFIVWGGAYRGDDKIDHVGRANRTMQPRLDFLNTLPPSEHLAEIVHRHDNPGWFQRLLMDKLEPLFAIRDYDNFADVMIYSRRFEAGFPNGRTLTDDVAKLACEVGDCLLWELSMGDTPGWEWPRQTTNDKPFLERFPYLANPW